jgi:TPR repeat protein
MHQGKTKYPATGRRIPARFAFISDFARPRMGAGTAGTPAIGAGVSMRRRNTAMAKRFLRIAAAGAVLLASLALLQPAEAAQPGHFDRGYQAYRAQDYGNALRWFVMAANQGDTAAQNMIGEMYARGEGVEQNDADALRWFHRAAEKRNPAAETNLGIAYREGYGVSPDYQQAYNWLKRAADAGHPAAFYHLGIMYEHGMLTTGDESYWIDLYEKAAKAGYGPAEARLGHMFEIGIGVDRDIGDAVYWYQKAAAHGQTTAQISLAMLYMSGEGVATDLVQAHAWLSIASFLGNRGATSLIVDLTKQLTAEQVAKSQAIASDMLARIFAPASQGGGLTR